ncbi:MAG: hypothetical protein JJ964_05390 [Rhizobiales bacterium]|nr:hypothetical protein [Hyphomicrobiales bacterium]
MPTRHPQSNRTVRRSRRAALLPCPDTEVASLLLRVVNLTLRSHPGLDPGSILAGLDNDGMR